jgi:hypothetical protein
MYVRRRTHAAICQGGQAVIKKGDGAGGRNDTKKNSAMGESIAE